MRIVKTIGILFETRDDAHAVCPDHPDLNYHWREPDELAAILSAVENLGFSTVLLGAPATFLRNLPTIQPRPDFILNLSVGFRSRFRLAAGPTLCELAGIPYSGADPYAKQLSQSKHLQKAFLDKLGLSTPPWTYIDFQDDPSGLAFPSFPLILKPAYEGSSIGIDADSVVHTHGELRIRLAALRETLQMPVIAEQFISGREIKVGMLGNDPPSFEGIIEDIHPDGSGMGKEFLHFNVKKEGSFRKTPIAPDDPACQRLLRDCRKIYSHVCPVDFGTFDIRIDERGCHFFLEFNADATCHPRRTLAQCCELNGLPFENMIGTILRSSMERQGLAWK